jgi:nicotinamide mononucleotide transporter
MTNWISENWIEIFGAVTGILYVMLEIKQNRLLWPVGIVTSGVYIWVFFAGKLYADAGLQVYYLVISVIGWYWWRKQSESEKQSECEKQSESESECEEEGRGAGGKGDVKSKNISHNPGYLQVSRIGLKTGIRLLVIFVLLYTFMWYLLSRFTDSPVPAADSFITSVSVVATWMLARKLYEHWYLWIIVNFFAAALFFTRELYPTVALYIIYGVMSFAGLKEWRKSIISRGSGHK